MPLSALAIGSMAPDLPYFIMLSDISKVGHTLSGLFLFCVPVGLAVLWLFHRCLKLPMLALAPESLRRRIPSDQQFHFFPLTRLLLLALCVLLGAVTHVLWDGFTHLRGMFAVLLPALQEMSPFWPHLPIYALLQHFSSVLGLAVLGAAYLSWLRKTPPSPQPTVRPISNGPKWLFLILGAVAAVLFGLYEGYGAAQLQPEVWREVFAVRTVIGTMAGALVELALYAIWWHLGMKKAPDAIASEASVSRLD